MVRLKSAQSREFEAGGRLLRRRARCVLFALVGIVHLVALPLLAQRVSGPPAVTVAGAGPETFVLVSGVVGGVAGFRRLEALLLARGHRVVIIDPYNLSLDSAEVTFAALARRVDAVLVAQGLTSVRVVGHSHGGGVGLRLAALYPARVSALYLLDVGALPENRTSVFSGAIRLLPLINSMPGGRAFLRARFIRGLEKNSSHHEWLDSATRSAYTDAVLDDLGRVVRLARRLADAREPDSLPTLVAGLRIPVTVILGDAPHESGLNPGELEALFPLGCLLHVIHMPGVGHFPHEEAAADVARHLLGPRHATLAVFETLSTK
jgi:pimeloyl-ACP methyl ester carboxylesterase